MAGFEKRLAQLETVVERLERGELSLEESVQLFEDGMKLSGICREELEQAEGRIQILLEGKGGKMLPTEFEVESEDEDPSGEDDQG